MKDKKKEIKPSSAKFYISVSSGNTEKEKFESLKAQYIARLEHQEEVLRESEQIVEAACG